MSSVGEPSSSTMRPCFSMMTRSHSRSTSPMLCEASRIVAPRSAAIVLEARANPVGGVRIERGGRLVEQQELGLVDQRLGQRDARLLPGRELAGGPIEKVAEREAFGECVDAPRQVFDAVEAAEYA